jgi:hypothetical protein
MRLRRLLARQKASALGVFAVLVLAGGCAAPIPLPVLLPPRIIFPDSEPRPVAPVAEPQPATTPLPAMAAMISPVPVVPPPPVDAASLRARYGPPDFVRREPDSELWRYDGADCAVFFFLYREGDVLRIRYSESMPRGADMPSDPKCVESLSAHAGAMS